MQDIELINSGLDSLSVAQTVRCGVDVMKTYYNQYNNKHSLKIFSQNIRSISSNLPNFVTLLYRSNIVWDVLVLSECWLQTAKYIPNLRDYNYLATTSHKTQNEGVVMYYRKHLNVTFDEPHLDDANCLLLNISSDTCIVGIYRPPSQYNTLKFTNSLESLLSKLNSCKNIILCGDINIDVADNSTDSRSYEYLNALASHSLLPAHVLPTHGKTCLDHMIIKTKLEATCFVIDSSVTDHDGVAVCLTLKGRPEYQTRARSRVNYFNLDIAMLNMTFQSVFECGNVDVAADLFVDSVSVAIKSNIELVPLPRRLRVSKPWITKGLIQCMRNRDNLYKKFKKDPNNNVLKITYKRYRNYCANQLKKAKHKHETQELEKAKHNKRNLWNVIKNISGSNTSIDHSKCLVSGEDPYNSVNAVNRFFVDIGRRLAEKASSISSSHRFVPEEPALDSPVNSLVLLPATEDEIRHLIQGLRDNCAVGDDQISGKILKRYMDLFIPAITHICNLAISTGEFPSSFKSAVVKPLHKSGSRDCVNNFRPISILPTISKILEKLINKRLVNFLHSNNILSSYQYGFRQGRSTGEAVSELINSIVDSLDEKRKCLCIFLDIAKAFDTVSIPLLLCKLEKLGVRGLPFNLLQNFLTNRTQRVKIENWLSDTLPVKCGVPQGSILGPTLFLIYINDLCELPLTDGKILTFADDTALFFSGKTWDEVYIAAQNGFDRICAWLRYNILTLNIDKTKYVAFGLKSNLLPPTSLTITAHTCTASTSECSCPPLDRTDHIRYLGVIIDQKLSFKPQIDVLVQRLRKLIYIFKTLKHVADKKVIKMVYHALCQSLLDYCISSWGGAAKSHLIEVERAQRIILKVAGGLSFRFPTDTLYKKWDLLTVRQSFILQTVMKKHSQLCYDPNLFQDKRRKHHVCKIPKSNTSFAQRFYSFLGALLYNNLNKKLNFYPLTKSRCKKSLTSYLKSLNYNETEKLLKIII